MSSRDSRSETDHRPLPVELDVGAERLREACEVAQNRSGFVTHGQSWRAARVHRLAEAELDRHSLHTCQFTTVEAADRDDCLPIAPVGGEPFRAARVAGVGDLAVVLAVYSIQPDSLAVPARACQDLSLDGVNGQDARQC